ncbi:glycosyltransferase family 1 protein [bacterium]|nr:glycosyltransferase family 1 protein [bacterium]
MEPFIMMSGRSEPARVRNVKLSFVGSKYGAAKYRYVARIPIIRNLSAVWSKKSFFERLENEFPFIYGYGVSWTNGFIQDAGIPALYSRSLLGVNVHNSLGPINFRLYDLSAYGVCQICDNKHNLHYVFEDGKEILGFESEKECFDLIRYYLAHPEEARTIGEVARQRFLRDYTIEKLWIRFFSDLERIVTS